MQTVTYKNIYNFVAEDEKAARVAEIIDRIGDKGRCFGVSFTKKDGTIREMNARLGVTKHLKGGERTLPQNYLVVFDMQKGQYRSLNPSTVISINSKAL